MFLRFTLFPSRSLAELYAGELTLTDIKIQGIPDRVNTFLGFTNPYLGITIGLLFKVCRECGSAIEMAYGKVEILEKSMVKLLLLDKDGTLIRSVSGGKFVNRPTDQAPISGAIDAIERYVAKGWTPIIASNQGGVAAGHKSLGDAIAEMEFALGLFPLIEEAFFCPSPTDTGGDHCWRVWGCCDEARRIRYGKGEDIPHRIVSELEESLRDTFRKPNPGMLKLAIALHNANPAACLMVGDRTEDEAAAQAAGVPFQWAHEWLVRVEEINGQ